MTDTHLAEKPTLSELFTKAYEPKSGQEFLSSEQMDQGFEDARECLQQELKRKSIVDRFNASNQEVRALTLEILNLQMSDFESGVENVERRTAILRRMEELNDEIDALVNEMRAD